MIHSKISDGECFALCTVSRNDFIVAYGGESDFNGHKDTSKHKGYVGILHNNKKLTNFCASSATANLDIKVVKAKLLFSAFLVEHELPLTSAHHAAKIFRNMFPDFKTMNKYWYYTKRTHMLAGAVSKQITSDLKEELLLIPWYRLVADGSSDEDDKLLPISV